MKKCSKCDTIKNENDFAKDKTALSGLKSWCKVCVKNYSLQNKDKIREYQKKYCQTEKCKVRRKIYREKIKERSKEYQKIYFQKNKKKISIREKNRRSRNEAWSQKKRDEKREISKIYQREYKRKRRQDPIFKLKASLRTRLYCFLKKNRNVNFYSYIGCSSEDLKKWIESKFKPGMSWSNHSKDGWHLDHIIPLSSAKTEQEVYKLCHYTNLQPLWAKENLSKNSKY